MSIDRYLSVVYPMRMIRFRTRKAVVKICFGVWILAILIALKVLIFLKNDYNEIDFIPIEGPYTKPETSGSIGYDIAVYVGI